MTPHPITSLLSALETTAPASSHSAGVFSYFASCRDTNPQGNVRLDAFVRAVREGRWRAQVEVCREALRTKGKEAYEALRVTTVPAVTLSASLKSRARNLTLAECMAEPSGNLQLDFDAKDHPEIAAEEMRRIVQSAPFVVGCFLSLSGAGIKAIARIPAAFEKHAGSWQAAKQYFAAHGLELDEVVKSPKNLCFVSFDPDAWFNPHAVELQPIEIPTLSEDLPPNDSTLGTDRQRLEVADTEVTEETEAILERLAAKNSLLPRLLKGEWEGDFASFPSQSEADFSLACSICEQTGNYSQQEEIFSQSGLYRENRKMRLALRAARERVALQRAGALAEMPDLPDENSPDEIPAFPVDFLPPVAAEMAREIARVSTSQNLQLAAASVLGVMAAAVGAALEITTSAGRTTQANLYLLVIAISGSGKSESLKPALKPFIKAEAETIQRWLTQTKPKLTSELAILKKQSERLLKGIAGQNDEDAVAAHAEVETRVEELNRLLTACPRFHVGDATKESLHSIIAGQPGEALASISAEARGILSVVRGRYGNGSGGDEDFYLAAYSGDRITVNRIGRPSVTLHRPCLTILWMVQPDAAESTFSDPAMMTSGMIPRFLLFDSQAEAVPRSTPPEPISKDATEAWDALIQSLLETYRSNGDAPHTVEVEAEAAALLYDYEQETIRLRGKAGKLRDVPALVARWAENAYRIALVLHAGRWGGEAHRRPLAASDAQSAIEIMGWFADSQLSVLAGMRTEILRKRLSALLTVLAENKGKITMRNLARIHGFKEDEVRLLQSKFPRSIVIEKQETGGRPSITVRKF